MLLVLFLIWYHKVNQWAHTATQLYTDKELVQNMRQYSYQLDWQAAYQSFS